MLEFIIEEDTEVKDNIRIYQSLNRAGYDKRSIFKRGLTGFEFRVFLLLD